MRELGLVSPPRGQSSYGKDGSFDVVLAETRASGLPTGGIANPARQHFHYKANHNISVDLGFGRETHRSCWIRCKGTIGVAI